MDILTKIFNHVYIQVIILIIVVTYFLISDLVRSKQIRNLTEILKTNKTILDIIQEEIEFIYDKQDIISKYSNSDLKTGKNKKHTIGV